MSDLVTDEMVEAAAKAIHDVQNKSRDPSNTVVRSWEHVVTNESFHAQYVYHNRLHARAALSAAAPLIAAIEREACAAIADAETTDSDDYAADTATRIAAGIRARGTP